MRILMTNHALHHIGGTETWTYTMAHELVSRGHEVEISTFVPGQMADRMPCRVFPFAVGMSAETYDLILINHNTCLAMVQKLQGFKIFTSHGPAHQLEAPAPGADCYVAVSEEVRGARTWPKGAFVIRQPIDLHLFRPQPALRPDDNDALVMTKNALACQLAAEACDQAGLTYNIAHYTLRPCFEPWDLIPLHRAVITSGRGILEALACGVPAFSLNHHQGRFFGDGWIMQENVGRTQKFNYSGRATDMDLDLESLTRELSEGICGAIMGHASRWGPAWIEQHHDARDVADFYLALKDHHQELADIPKEAPCPN